MAHNGWPSTQRVQFHCQQAFTHVIECIITSVGSLNSSLFRFSCLIRYILFDKSGKDHKIVVYTWRENWEHTCAGIKFNIASIWAQLVGVSNCMWCGRMVHLPFFSKQNIMSGTFLSNYEPSMYQWHITKCTEMGYFADKQMLWNKHDFAVNK